MPTGDFPKGKEFNCPDCPMTNGHYDAVPRVNFCATCERTRNKYYSPCLDDWYYSDVYKKTFDSEPE